MWPKTDRVPVEGRASAGLAHGTWSCTRDYLPAEREFDLLRSRHPGLEKDLLKCLVKAAGDLRRAHAAEELTSVITTRRLLALCARLARGNDLTRALAVCVLNKVPPEDRKVVSETFDHHVGPLAKSKV